MDFPFRQHLRLTASDGHHAVELGMLTQLVLRIVSDRGSIPTRWQSLTISNALGFLRTIQDTGHYRGVWMNAFGCEPLSAEGLQLVLSKARIPERVRGDLAMVSKGRAGDRMTGLGHFFEDRCARQILELRGDDHHVQLMLAFTHCLSVLPPMFLDLCASGDVLHWLYAEGETMIWEECGVIRLFDFSDAPAIRRKDLH